MGRARHLNRRSAGIVFLFYIGLPALVAVLGRAISGMQP